MQATAASHRAVSREQWVAAHTAHPAKEKELTRLRDQVSRHCRELLWTKAKKRYVFETPDGPRALADLFDGRSQLFVTHFMFGPEWKEGRVGPQRFRPLLPFERESRITLSRPMT